MGIMLLLEGALGFRGYGVNAERGCGGEGWCPAVPRASESCSVLQPGETSDGVLALIISV